MKIRVGLLLLVFLFLFPFASISKEDVEENSPPKNYSRIGTASWYGIRHHGDKTASGERFDMHDYTAAHKSLPMGTVVRVINLKNGRDVIVRVNDRGPFKKGKIIDLSYAAAKSIGMIKSGTAKVKVEVVPKP